MAPGFSVCLPAFAGGSAFTRAVDWGELESYARDAEALGYSCAWIADHLILGHEGGELEAWTALSALAAATTKLRVGPLVLGNTHRNPALVAKMAATLDYLSAGRVNLGVGAGWYEREHAAYGLPFIASVGERMDRLDEAIRLMKAMFTAEPATFQGRFYRAEGAACQPAPVQRPWPALWIGGGGERRTLRIVAEHADAWNLPAVDPETYEHKLEVLRGHCAAVGRDYRDIEKTMETRVLVTDGSRSTDARLAAWLNYWRETAGDTPLGEDEAVARVRGQYIIGTVEECRRKVRGYVEAGVEHFTPYFLDYPSRTSLELFATAIVQD